jgi:hypothetical protein
MPCALAFVAVRGDERRTTGARTWAVTDRDPPGARATKNP